MGPWKDQGALAACPEAPMAPKSRSRLCEALEKNDGEAKASRAKRQRLQRRDSEDKVDRVLHTHFRDFTTQQTDGTTRNGLTLRQKLLEEFRTKVADGGRISAIRLKQLRLEYTGSGDPIRSLVILDPNQPFNKDLMRALAAGENPNPAKRSQQPLYAYLDTTNGLNQKEVVVLLRSIIGTSPSASVSLRKHILEILKAVVRLGLHKQFSAEVVLLFSIWDETLALTWTAMKAGGMIMDQFWEAYGHLVDIIGIHSEMQQIFEEGVANFTKVKAQIHKVTSASVLGAKMWGAAATMLKVEDFSAQVDAAIELLRQKTAVTDKEISNMKDTHAELKYPTQNIVTQHTFTQRLYPKDPNNIYSTTFTQRLYPTCLYPKDLYPKPPPSKKHPKDSTQNTCTQRPLPLRPYPKETYHKDFSPTTLT